MKEVSCRHFSYWFQLVERDGGSIERTIARIPFSKEYLLQPGNRIDWNDYVTFCEDCIAELGGLDRVRTIPQIYGGTGEMGYLRKIVGLFASPRKVYEFIILKHGKSLYTHLHFELTDLPDARLQILIRIPDSYTDSPEWFWGSEPSFAGMTQLIGLPPAKIETEVRVRLGIYTLTLPESRTLTSKLRRVGRSLLAPLGFLQIVDTQQAELRQIVAELESERDTLNHLLASIPEGILIVSKERVKFFNSAIGSILGLRAHQDGQEIEISALPLSLHGILPGRRRGLPSGSLVEFVSRSEFSFRGQPAELIVIRDVTELQRVEDRIAEATAQEREKLAHDLHDGLGQYLAALNLKASSLATTDRPSHESLLQIAQLSREAAKLSRDLTHAMGPGYVNARDIVGSLRKLCSRMETLFPTQFTFTCSAIRARAKQIDASELFFLTKEALTNAAKHASAKTIALELRQTNGFWQIAIADDGCGFDPAAILESGQGLGLESMQLRAARLGGDLAIHSRRGDGCQLLLTLPAALLEIADSPPSSTQHLEGSTFPSDSITTRVYLADDHAIVRDGIQRLISGVDGIDFAGGSDTLHDLERHLRDSRANTLVIDWLLAGTTAESIIRSLRAAQPDLRIVVLTMFEATTHKDIALTAGANAFVNKSEPPERLLEALRH